MRDEKEGRMEQARSNKQQGKATQYTQEAVTFSKKNELPRVGLCTQYLLVSVVYIQVAFGGTQTQHVHVHTKYMPVHVHCTL